MKALAISAFVAFLSLAEPSFAQVEAVAATTTTTATKKWPTLIPASKELGKYKVKETEQGFLYETASYRVEIPEKIDSALIANFVMSAESVALALKSLPLPLYSLTETEKALIKISLDEEAYAAAGGPKGTAGFFDGRTQTISIQWDQLNRVSPASRLLPRPAFDLLVHEITHLCMHGTLWKMDTWLGEGVAEYLAAAHLEKGNFDFTKMEKQIRDHIRNQTAAIGPKVQATKISTLLRLSSQDWLRRTAELPPKAALQSYTSALLLTHFSFHGGSERRQKVHDYLKALEKVRYLHQQKPILYSQAEAAEIEKKLQAYWKPRGLQLEFR